MFEELIMIQRATFRSNTSDCVVFGAFYHLYDKNFGNNAVPLIQASFKATYRITGPNVQR